MIKVVVCGIAGRMCGRIAHMVMEAEDLDLVGGVEAPENPAVGRDVGEVLGAAHLGVHVVDDLKSVVEAADVVVAFTAPPDGTVDAAKIAGEAGKAMVVGTTALSPT